MIIKNVVVLQDFVDGSLAEAFADLGYPARWRRGERRDLPQEILARVTLSGGVISIDQTAPESRVVEGAEPSQNDLQAIYEKKYGKARKIRVMFPEGFRSGDLANECAAIGHPAEFGVGEISDVPADLLDKIIASGATVATDAESIRQAESQQGKHRLKVSQWQEEQEQIAKQKKSKLATNAHNESILAEIEQVDAEYITATGKTKEALWQRRMELRKSLR